MQFPNFDPIAIQLGPLAIRWYALAFISGLLAGWGYIVYLLQRPPTAMTKTDVSDFFTWAIIGVVAGGRVGYVSFYMPGYYASNPLEVFFLWQGGMSFHGGLIGMLVVIAAFAHKRKVTLLALSDLVAAATPDRAVPRAHRQLHQWRAVRPADGRALGRCLSRRR